MCGFSSVIFMQFILTFTLKRLSVSCHLFLVSVLLLISDFLLSVQHVSSQAETSDVIPLCCCKVNGASFAKLASGHTYCQALDSVDNKVRLGRKRRGAASLCTFVAF